MVDPINLPEGVRNRNDLVVTDSRRARRQTNIDRPGEGDLYQAPSPGDGVRRADNNRPPDFYRPPGSGIVYVAEGTIEVAARPRRRRRGVATSSPLSDTVMLPWWEDNERGAEWDTVIINGHQWPGVARLEGKGISRKLDAKSSGGSDGARIVDKGYEPGEWALTLVAWTVEHLDALGALVPSIHPRRVQPGAAVGIYHPALALLDINAGVVKTVGLLGPGSVVGTRELKISFIEHRPATPRPPRATTAATTVADTTTGFPPPTNSAATAATNDAGTDPLTATLGARRPAPPRPSANAAAYAPDPSNFGGFL